MRFLVVLDAKTPIGETYLAGNNDGTASGHPVLDCKSIDGSSYQYLVCTRDSSRSGVKQTIHVPHHAVAYILEYAKGDERPFGLVPPPEKKSAR
jgi:hypothetical protein